MKIMDHVVTETVDPSNRNIAVDCIRVIALLCVFLLHSSPTKKANAILQFCVPAMMFISGLCYHGNISSWKEYGSYLKKRFLKIVVPASLFALLFGLSVDCFCFAIKRECLFSAIDILNGVILYKGIGYVWIMRVFFFIALLSPAAQKMDGMDHDGCFIGCNLLIYSLYRIVYILLPSDTVWYDLFYYFIFETVPYFIIWTTGMRYKKMKREGKSILVTICICVLIFELVKNKGDICVIRATKYPPSNAYMVYGLTTTMMLYEGLKKRFGKGIEKNRFIDYICLISSKSNALYLAHIPFVYFVFMIEEKMNLPYLLKFIFIWSAASISLISLSCIRKKLRNIGRTRAGES